MEWLHALQRAHAANASAVLVSVGSGRGSTPREAGAKMVVTAQAQSATIGGGEMEFQALATARAMLVAQAAEPRQGAHRFGHRFAHRFTLGANLGQICGGAAQLIFEQVDPDAEWVRVLAAWHEQATPCVLVTTQGGDAGGEVASDTLPDHLLVAANTTWGSLGSAELDRVAIAHAQAVLADPAALPSAIAIEQCHARIWLEPLRINDFQVVLFGAGHVGRALAQVLGALDCSVRWIDSRMLEFPSVLPPNVVRAVTQTAVDEVSTAPPGAYFLVMTHSHALDLELVHHILTRADFAFCGMIGSATKRRTFEHRLTQRGIDAATLARLTCPIGIAEIEGKEPGTIAVAVAAQMIALRERRRGAQAGMISTARKSLTLV